MDNGLGSWPCRRARMAPDAVALVHGEDRITYGALAERVERLADALQSLGVKRQDRVAYLGPNHPSYVETLFATARLGAVFVPLNTRLAPAEIEFMLADSGASVFIWAPSQVDTVAAISMPATLNHLITTGTATPDSADYDALVAAAQPSGPAEDVALDDIALILYTSGTTGRPKGAMLTHGNVTWNTYNVLIDVDVRATEVALVSAPLFHVAALNELFLPTFIKGGTSVLEAAFDPEQTLHLIHRHGVSWVFGVPAMFFALAQHPQWAQADLSSLRTVMCGGAPVPLELIRLFQARGLTFVQGYGMTECAPGLLFLRAEQSEAKAGSAGTPCFFTDVRVVDEANAPTAPGETGEIQGRGPHVMPGYWGLPTETADSFVDGDWFRTGDAAVVDSDGYHFIVDRIKDMYISGGENVYPAEVERILVEHPNVRECAVIGIDDERWGQVGRALVVPFTEPLDGDELLEFLAVRLARYKVPKSVHTVVSIPRNAGGKVLRRELRATHSGS